jgi:hypothetical protein
MSISEDRSGRPSFLVAQGEPVWQGTFLPAQVNEQFEFESINVVNPENTCSSTFPMEFYRYTLTVTPAVEVKVGQRYWLNIVAELPPTDTIWGWRVGTPDNQYSLIDTGGPIATYSVDVAFSLSN